MGSNSMTSYIYIYKRIRHANVTLYWKNKNDRWRHKFEITSTPKRHNTGATGIICGWFSYVPSNSKCKSLAIWICIIHTQILQINPRSTQQTLHSRTPQTSYLGQINAFSSEKIIQKKQYEKKTRLKKIIIFCK